MNLLIDIENLVSAKLDVVKTAVSILKLETRLAGLSVYPLLLNLCFLLVGLVGMWTTAMLALGYILELWIHNILLSLVTVLALQIMIIFGLLKYLSFNLNNMSFSRTRQFIAKKEHAYVEQKKTNSQRSCQHGATLTLPRSVSRRKKK